MEAGLRGDFDVLTENGTVRGDVWNYGLRNKLLDAYCYIFDRFGTEKKKRTDTKIPALFHGVDKQYFILLYWLCWSCWAI